MTVQLASAPSVRSLVSISRRGVALRATVWGLVLVGGFGVPYALSMYQLQLAVQGVTLGIAALGVGWLRRQTGLLSFGHAAFYGFSSYGVALLSNLAGTGTGVALLLGALGGALAALLIGAVIVRAGGIAFSMLTLATGMLIYVTVVQNRDVTHGYDGLPIQLQTNFLGKHPNAFGGPVQFWPVAWTVLLAVIAISWLIARSVFGRHLVAIRENPERTRFTGRRTYLPKVIAFTFSGFLASLAGALSALNTSYVSPDSLFWSMSGQILVVAVIGGVGSFWGPPIGALIYVFLQASLAASPYYLIVIGSILIVVVIAAPGGIVELATRVSRLIPRLRERKESRRA